MSTPQIAEAPPLITTTESTKEILDQLDRQNIPWTVTDQGDLWVRIWQVAKESFVPKEQVAVIRKRATLPCPHQSEVEWLGDNLDNVKREYAGKWVAILNSEIIASSESLPGLMTVLKEHPGSFITQIPAEPINWSMAYGIQEF